MDNYRQMSKAELMRRVMGLGVNPYTMTVWQMIQFLEHSDIASKMSDEELLRKIQNKC